MIDECPVCDKYNVARVRVYRPTWPVESRLLCEEHANDAFRAGVGILEPPARISITKGAVMAKPPCAAPGCKLISWSRTLCAKHYHQAADRQEEIETTGTTPEQAWRAAIAEITTGKTQAPAPTASSLQAIHNACVDAVRAALGLPADNGDLFGELILKVNDLRKEANELRAAQVSLAATRKRASDAEAERDALRAAAAGGATSPTEEVAVLRARAEDAEATSKRHIEAGAALYRILTQLAGYLGAPDDGPWEELPDRLAALLSAHKAEVAELRQDLVNVRAERDCGRGTAKAIRDAADEKESQLRKALSRADSLGMEIARLEEHAAAMEASASRANRAADSLENTIADLKRYPAQIRIEWSENRVNLDVVAGEYRFTLASIFPAESPYVRLYAFPEEGEEQKIHGRDLADVVAITSSILSLRGIAVPPYPVAE